MKDQLPPHAFISYVRDNQEQVDRLCEDLKAYGVNYWLDRNDIKPGARWKDAIRNAINEGAFFIACFSQEYHAREEPYMNEELNLATERLRKMHHDRTWFIPVLLAECDIPARGIGPEETLKDINWVPLYENWDAGIESILSVIKPTPPEIQNLIVSLRSEGESLHKWAAKYLGDIGPEAKAAVPALIDTLKDEHGYVRREAATALGKIGDVRSVEPLINALRDRNDEVRRAAYEALEKINTPEAQEAIEEYRKKPNLLL